MITFTLLSLVAVGTLLAATAYFVCRNEIVRKTSVGHSVSINGNVESKVFGRVLSRFVRSFRVR
jgi:hypothetical protein